MPRQSRIDAPGALHHIIIRGIERKAIFKDAKDRANFLERLGKILLESSTPCYAWALLNNHVHLLLRTGEIPISVVMRRLLTGYAQQFNRRHRRHGYLFQNRYKSILCQEDPYLLELVRYIHLNPIRAGVVRDLEGLHSYPYSGHAVIMGRQKRLWQDTDYVLGFLGKAVKEARRSYWDFVSNGLSLGRRPDLVGGGLIRSHGGWANLKALRSRGLRLMGDERILGSSDFVENILRESGEAYEKKTRSEVMGLSLENLLDAVTDHFEVEKTMLKSESRKRKIARARSIVCALAADYLIISGRELAQHLNLCPSAVSKLTNRGRQDKLTEEIANKLMENPSK